jgi:hypothetical protein
MAVERYAAGTSLMDVLDRVLDKGIVIDAWVRISLVGIDLITVEARVVVASIDTYLKYAEAVGIAPMIARTGSVQGTDQNGLPSAQADPATTVTAQQSFTTRRGTTRGG